MLSKEDNPPSPEASVTVSLSALFNPVSDFTIKEYVPSPLFIMLADTPVRLFSEFATDVKVAPEFIVKVSDVFAELTPKPALCAL